MIIRSYDPDASPTGKGNATGSFVCRPSTGEPYSSQYAVIVEGGPVIEAFARIGWEWGGDWNQSKDYQHFTQNGL